MKQLLPFTLLFLSLGLFGQYVPVQQNGKWGLSDSSGKIVLEPLYDVKPYRFTWCPKDNDSLGVFWYARLNDRWSVFSADLRQLNPSGYDVRGIDTYCGLSEPFFVFQKDDGFSLYSVTAGKIVCSGLSAVSGVYRQMQDGLYYGLAPYLVAATKSKGKNRYGILSLMHAGRTETIVPLEQDRFHYNVDYEDGQSVLTGDSLFIAFQNSKTGVFNTSGKCVLPFVYDTITLFEHCRRLVLRRGNKHFIANFTGKITDSTGYDYFQKNKYAEWQIVGMKGRYGMVDLRRGKLLPLEYDTFTVDYSKGLVIRMRKDGAWATFTPRGEKFVMDLDTQADSYKEISNGDSSVWLYEKNGLWGVLNSSGKSVAGVNYDHYEAPQENGRWTGLIRLREAGSGTIRTITANGIELPDTLNDTELWARQARKLKADKIVSDRVNEDGVFVARIKKTGKWGLFQSFGEGRKMSITEVVPPVYDHVDFFSPNGEFTAVYNNGKVGFFRSRFTDSNAGEAVPCRYEAYRIVRDKNSPRPYTYVAVKKEGKWGWVDLATGNEVGAFVHARPADLLEAE